MSEASNTWQASLETVTDLSDESDAPHFFDGADRGEVLEKLEHLSQWARMLILVTGPSGAGKSTLCDRVVAHIRLRNHASIVRLSGSLMASGERLLAEIAGQMEAGGAGLDNEIALRRLIVQHAAAEVAHDRFTLVVLDDAHELNTDALTALLSLADEAGSQRALNILLFGDDSLAERATRLDEAAGPQPAWHHISLRELTLAEARQFLRDVDPEVAAALDGAALERVHRIARGLPGGMLALARQAVAADAQSWRRFPALIAGVVGVLVLILATLFMVGGDDEPEAVVAGVQVETINLPGQAEGAQTVRVARVPVQINMPTADGDERARSATSGNPSAGVRPAPRPLGIRQPAQAPQEPTLSSRNFTAVPSQPRADRPAVSPPGGTQRAGNTTSNPSNNRGAGRTPTNQARPPAPTRQAEPTQPQPAGPTVARRSVARDLRDNAWAGAQPRENFTLQLHGLSNLQAARSFVARNRGVTMHIVEVDRSGQPWFLVLHGSYGDRDAALRAISRLPGGLQRPVPWVRQIAGVQTAIASR